MEKQKRADELREQKRKIYAEFLRGWARVMNRGNAVTAEDADLVAQWKETAPELIMWGGPDVISTFIKLKTAAEKGEDIIPRLEAFLQAVRKEFDLPEVKGLVDVWLASRGTDA